MTNTTTPAIIIATVHGTRPMDFPGTAEEIAANQATHDIDPQWNRCTFCDCRPWGTTVDWPCGSDVPRVDY